MFSSVKHELPKSLDLSEYRKVQHNTLKNILQYLKK